MYLLTNGKLITEQEVIIGYDLLIEGDRIAAIAPRGTIPTIGSIRAIDLEEGYLAPGLIDIHSDYIEHMAAPRPTSLMDFGLSIREMERGVIGHGITTFFHSLSLMESDAFAHKPIRDPKNVRKLIDLIASSHQAEHLIRHRFHARLEIDYLDVIEDLKQYIADDRVHLISFMDHTPGQGQYHDLALFRKTLLGYRDYSDEQLDSIIDRQQSKEKLTLDALKDIADAALQRGIPVASHDDDTLDKVQLVQSFGATISEFPTSLPIARAAKQAGMLTVAGAPNVLLGGSHSGNLCAGEAIADNSIDILCSDYYPPAMLHAVFKLHLERGLDLAAMMRLVTINPAKAVRMDEEIGSLAVGKKADMVWIGMLEERYPVVRAAFVDGYKVIETNYRQTEGRTVFAYDHQAAHRR